MSAFAKHFLSSVGGPCGGRFNRRLAESRALHFFSPAAGGVAMSAELGRKSTPVTEPSWMARFDQLYAGVGSKGVARPVQEPFFVRSLPVRAFFPAFLSGARHHRQQVPKSLHLAEY
jgi:hypothetical protein